MLFTIDSFRAMRHDSASSSTSDVSSVQSKLAPPWVSGHMTYPGRRSGSNESDRTSDVSQQSLSAKQSNRFSMPKTKFLADSGSPVISHHIASPPESRRPFPRAGSSVMASPSKARTLSSESSNFGSMARQKIWDKRASKERSGLDSTSSRPARHLLQVKPAETEVVVAHGPARAKPFIGRANTIQLPMATNETRPSGLACLKSTNETDKSRNIQHQSRFGARKLEEQEVLKDIDNTIQDITKALKRDTHDSLSQITGKSVDFPIMPIALHTTDMLNLATAKEERIFKYKQARRKELAKIANQGKSKSMELPRKGKGKGSK